MLHTLILKLERNGLSQENQRELKKFFLQHLEEQLIPYWEQYLDHEYGGIYTCISNDGQQLISKDKYIWSQGRFAWLWSRQVDLIQRGISTLHLESFTSHTQKTLDFLLNNAFSSDNQVYFLLDRKGNAKVWASGRGLHSSIFADCFLLSGLTEYSRVFQDRQVFDKACALYRSIWQRFEAGINIPSDPYPTPSAFKPYSFNMIMLYLAWELFELSAEQKAHSSNFSEILRNDINTLLHRQFTQYHDKNNNYRTVEMYPQAGEDLTDTLLYRHFTPGHTLEALWFSYHAANSVKKDYAQPIIQASLFALQRGWDTEYGGLLRIVDALAGGEPQGSWGDRGGRGQLLNGEAFENLIVNTWNKKLWWPHSEGLYASLLLALEYNNKDLADWFVKLFTYTMQTFPESNGNEWIQIRTRNGTPVEEIVALPVKDPYHIMRCIQLMIQLLDKHA